MRFGQSWWFVGEVSTERGRWTTASDIQGVTFVYMHGGRKGAPHTQDVQSLGDIEEVGKVHWM